MRHFPCGLLLLLASCSSKVEGPPPIAPREASQVNAPVSKTWDAVVGVFADLSIPIRTMERASGLIVTDPLSVDPRRSDQWADCGESRSNRASYNVLVRGDRGASTVKVTVRWTYVGDSGVIRECRTRGVWEQRLEGEIAIRAQG